MFDALRKILMVSATAALVLTPAATVLTLATADAAHAKNGHGNNGGRGSDRNGNSGGRGKPDTAGGRQNTRSTGATTRGKGRGLFGIILGKPDKVRSTTRNRGTVATAPRRTTTPRRAPVTKVVKVSPVPKARPLHVPGPAVQSELKWMNAANASLNAYVNASPDSRVGQMAAYREALLGYRAAADDPEYAEELDGYVTALGDFAPEGATDEELEQALADIQALDAEGVDPDPEALEDILADLNPDATDEEIAELEPAIVSDNEIADLAEERDLALEIAADGIVLEPGSAAWDHFHELLKLDQELPEAGDADLDEVEDGDDEEIVVVD